MVIGAPQNKKKAKHSTRPYYWRTLPYQQWRHATNEPKNSDY